jgi:DNA-binding response OmpR family regulator
MAAGLSILVVEDDPAVASSLLPSLESAGFSCHLAPDGRTALEIMSLGARPIDVVLLDLGLPDMDGLDVCRTIRADSKVPIIMVSARGDESDRIVGLELGADDYVVKPFSQRELTARIRAVMRRAADELPPASGAGGPLVIDERTRTVLLEGQPVELTAKEFDLLAFLAQEPGVVFRRSEILEHVWDVNWYGTTKTLDVHVASLRKKLGDPSWIQAVRGVGFRFVLPDAAT